jgi:hypothetical protein
MLSRIFFSSGVGDHLFRLFQMLVLALFLFVPAVKADQLVLIDFDSPLPSNLAQTKGIFLTTILVDENGIVVDRGFGGVMLLPTPAAVSPPQAAFANQVNPLFKGINEISGEFLFLTSEGVLVPATTRLVSFNVVATQGTWTVLFIDSNNLITTITGNTDQLVVFSTSAGISQFIFIPSGLNVLEGIDNLQFEATSVPEPASLLLLAIGIGGLSARARSKRHSRLTRTGAL